MNKELQEQVEFNRQWWTNVQEGERISQDEIDEVLSLISTIESQAKELERLKKIIENLQVVHFVELQREKSDNQQLRIQLDKAVVALEWYAKDIHYNVWPSELWHNKGEIAREVLSHIQGKENNNER